MSLQPPQSRRASIILVMMLILALSVAVLSLASYVLTSSRVAQQAEANVRAQIAAEAALELNAARIAALADELKPTKPGLPDTTDRCNLSTVPSSLFPASAGYRFDTNLVTPVEGGVPVAAFTAASDASLTYRYLAQSTVTYRHPMGGPQATVSLQRVFIQRLMYIFQYAIFYDQDGELHPGANFTVGGRVHSNGTFYYGASNLTFQGVVTHSGPGLPRYAYNPLDAARSGTPGGPVVFSLGIPPARIPVVDFPCRRAVASDANMSGPIEFIEMPVAGADGNASQREFTKAGVKVMYNTRGGRSYTANGSVVPARSLGGFAKLGVVPAAQQTTAVGLHPGFLLFTRDNTLVPLRNQTGTAFNPLYVQFDDILNGTNQYIQDQRQNLAYRVVAIDVGLLTNAVDAPTPLVPTIVPTSADYGSASGKALWNGILYVHDASYVAGTQPSAVALKDGTNLPTCVDPIYAPGGGLTVVTDHPAYIIGDYNTGGVGSSVPSNVSGGAAEPTVAGYTRRPAAVMADAITVLSRNWGSLDIGATGVYNVLGYGSRNATSTTVNAAFLSGHVPSDGSYSGGAENFPRLLEAWGGASRTLTYYGSMIILFTSRQAPARWIAPGTYYGAPPRNWYFDTRFLNPNLLPPGTPSTVNLSNGEWVNLAADQR